MIECLYCSNTFSTKGNLKKHIINKKCSLNSNALWECHEQLINKTKTDRGSLNNVHTHKQI
jgi:hypothetical protein